PHPFVNGAAKSSLATEPALATAPGGSPVGTYAITIGGAVDPDYVIDYTAGTLTVNPAELTLVADDQTKTYGDANPALTFYDDGAHPFVNGDSKSSLTTQPT